MSRMLPVFVIVPLVAAFVLPVLGARGKSLAKALAMVVTGSMLALAVFCVGRQGVYEVGNWSLRIGIVLVLDGLSCLLLLAVGVVSTASVLFGIRYMEQYTGQSKYLSLFMLLVTGMNGLVLSGDIFNLFVFLEIASLASYALVGFGGEHEELEAAFKYTVLGNVGSTLILLGIALVYGNTGALNMAYVSRAIQQTGVNTGLAFALALFVVGFGLKAALVPFHAWLPDAHPSAPAPISAMLSGVLIKTLGVYALCRLIFNVYGVSVSVAWVLIALGVVSMVIGVFCAVGQWDFKRLLAYHSISQMGYVVIGLGLGALILAQRRSLAWASLAILGGLFHLVNHAAFKSLLFLNSGSVQMATGTRQLKQLGGLADRLPVTRATCMIASASIAGVPPFNGFWSKLLIVLAAVQAGLIWLGAATVLVSLVTLISFLKVQRYVFLGELPDSLREVREHRGSMALAMTALACLCVGMGLLLLVPALKSTVLDPAVQVLMEGLGYSTRVINLCSSKG